MDLRILVNLIFFTISKASIINGDVNTTEVSIPDNVFNGVYSECFLHLSYSCLQKKTLLYLKELNNLSEVSVIGDYVKFGKSFLINMILKEVFFLVFCYGLIKQKK